MEEDLKIVRAEKYKNEEKINQLQAEVDRACEEVNKKRDENMEFDENNKRCKEDITELNVKLDKMIEENKNRTERNTDLETEVDRLGRNIAAITEEKNTFSKITTK